MLIGQRGRSDWRGGGGRGFRATSGLRRRGEISRAAGVRARRRLTKSSSPAGRIREHDVEAVASFGEKPFLHLIGDHRGRADESQPADSRRRAARVGGPSDSRARRVRARARGRSCSHCFQGCGQWTVGIEARDIVAEGDRERSDARCRNGRGCRVAPASPGLGDALADDDEGARQNLQMIAIAAERSIRPFTSA